MTPAEVKRVAALARLAVSDEEAAALAGQLSGILEIIRGALGDGLADSGLPSTPPGDDGPRSGALRADDPGTDPLSEPPAEWAPGWRDGFFTVPRLASHRAAGEEG